jgi:propanol-preferring alcohol dehydrogenase
MRAMVLRRLGEVNADRELIEFARLPVPEPVERELLIMVSACGVCHTELDEIEGRTPPRHLPVILGHQVVGRIEKMGVEAGTFHTGDRVGVGWFYSSCGQCRYCWDGNENLCPEFRATGRDANGGYADYMLIPESSVFPIPDVFTDTQAAPLLCAGAIGYRSLRLCNLREGQSLGLTGFGASAHLVLQMALHRFPNSPVYVFARSERERQFALELGATWSGDTEEKPPDGLDAIIDTTPVWKPVVEALKNLHPGGRLVINAIRKEKSDLKYLLNLNYARHLWMEKEIKSVANVCRNDISEFLQLAAQIQLQPEVEEFPLEAANQALLELKSRRIRGAKVLKIA